MGWKWWNNEKNGRILSLWVYGVKKIPAITIRNSNFVPSFEGFLHFLAMCSGLKVSNSSWFAFIIWEKRKFLLLRGHWTTKFWRNLPRKATKDSISLNFLCQFQILHLKLSILNLQCRGSNGAWIGVYCSSKPSFSDQNYPMLSILCFCVTDWSTNRITRISSQKHLLNKTIMIAK